MRKWSLDSCSPPVLISSTTPFSLLCLRLENIYTKLLVCSRGDLWCGAVSGEENERTVVIEQTSPLNSLFKSNLVLKYDSSFLHVPPGCRCSTLAHNFERYFTFTSGRIPNYSFRGIWSLNRVVISREPKIVLRQTKGQRSKHRPFNSLRWQIYLFNSVVNTKLQNWNIMWKNRTTYIHI